MGYRGLTALPTLALALAGCGGGTPAPVVELENTTDVTGGKALVFTASTDEKLVQQGTDLALELRGVDVAGARRGSYERPDYVADLRCTSTPCEWTVLPEKAGAYEFTAFVVDLRSRKHSARSQPVRAAWSAPPRPRGFDFFINGKRFPLTPLETGTDEYLPVPAGTLRVEAAWTGDAAQTGYAVLISNGRPELDTQCSTGTSCRFQNQVELAADEEMSWRLHVQTARGEKVVESFQVCLVGRA